MLKILILICPIAIDHAACDQKTAIDVIRSENVVTCASMGQTMTARADVLSDPARQYLKIMCVRDREARR